MAGFRNALETAIRGQICRMLNEPNPVRLPWWDNLYGPDGLLPDGGPVRRAFNNGAMAYFCDSPNSPIPTRPTGGLCVGTQYRVYVTAQCMYYGENLRYEAYYASLVNRGEDTAKGPLRGINVPSLRTGGMTSLGPILEGLDGSLTGKYPLTPYGNNQGNRTDFRSGDNQALTAEVTSIQVLSGSDNCGDAVPRAPLPPLPGRTFPITVDNRNGIIQIGAGNVAVNGDLIVPVNIELPDLNFRANVNIFAPSFEFSVNPDLEVGINPELEIGINPDFDFGGGNPPGEPDPPTQEPPGKRGIIGVIVTTTTTTLGLNSTRVPQDVNPDIYLPSLGHVNFRYKIKDDYVWSSDIKVKNKREYIPCPVSFAAVAVQGTPMVGVQWTLTPVYASVKKVEFL